MKLAYDRGGAGRQLVFIHPLGADRRVWQPVFDRLCTERNVIALDLPGFGNSPPLTSVPTPPTLAKLLGEFFDELALDTPDVAGNSLGGWIALELALTGHARSVTAIAPAGLWATPLMPRSGSGRKLARRALPVVPLLTRWPAARRTLLGSTMAHPSRVPSREAAHLIHSYLTAPGFQATNAAMRADRFHGLDNISVPVTLAWPDQDNLVSRPTHLPAHVRNLTLPGCGHIPMWDDPQRVAQTILDGSSGYPSGDVRTRSA
jgi:pimeloyl-ACP methyl ester carboxylesterase